MKEYSAEKIVQFSICVLISVTYFIDLPVGMFTFHFAHANIFHLIGNIIAISVLFVGVDPKYLLPAYIITSLLWPLSEVEAVGFSAIVYFMWGARAIRDFKIISSTSEKSKQTALIYAIGIIAAITISAIIPNVSFILHFFPFVAGVITSATIILIRMYKRDMTV